MSQTSNMQYVSGNSQYYIFTTDGTRVEDPSRFQLYDGASDSSLSSVYTTFSTQLLRPENINTRSGEKSAPQVCFFQLDRHIERLLDNLGRVYPGQALSSIFDKQWIRGQVISAVRDRLLQQKNDFPDEDPRAKIRLVSRNIHSLELFIEGFQTLWPTDRPLRVASTSLSRQNPRVKTCNISHTRAARAQALEKGFDEVLLLDEERFVLEGATSNVFWFDREGTLHTPSDGCLLGITRENILALHACEQDMLTLDEMRTRAAEVFLTQSTSGISPVAYIDDKAVSNGMTGPLTQSLIETYTDFLNKHAEAIAELTPGQPV